MRVKDALDFGDPVGMEESFVAKANDRLGLRAIEVAARIGHHAIVSQSHRPRMSLSDDVVKGDCGGNLSQAP